MNFDEQIQTMSVEELGKFSVMLRNNYAALLWGFDKNPKHIAGIEKHKEKFFKVQAMIDKDKLRFARSYDWESLLNDEDNTTLKMFFNKLNAKKYLYTDGVWDKTNQFRVTLKLSETSAQILPELSKAMMVILDSVKEFPDQGKPIFFNGPYENFVLFVNEGSVLLTDENQLLLAHANSLLEALQFLQATHAYRNFRKRK